MLQDQRFARPSSPYRLSFWDSLAEADLVMRSHVTRVVAQCFAVLRHLQLISRMLSPSTLKTVVVALVLSRLDFVYVNSVLTGLGETSAIGAQCFGLSDLRTQAIRSCLCMKL